MLLGPQLDFAHTFSVFPIMPSMEYFPQINEVACILSCKDPNYMSPSPFLYTNNMCSVAISHLTNHSLHLHAQHHSFAELTQEGLYNLYANAFTSFKWHKQLLMPLYPTASSIPTLGYSCPLYGAGATGGLYSIDSFDAPLSTSSSLIIVSTFFCDKKKNIEIV